VRTASIAPILLALLTACAADAHELADTPAGPVLAVRAAGFVDVRAGKLVRDAVLVVRGERIAAVGPRSEVDVPEGARVLDLGELVLVPGLIDVHTHLAWGPSTAGQPLPGTDEARATIEAGFTTVRNLGSTRRADLALKRAIEAGEIPGPRMQVALSGIGPRGGVCDQVFGGEATAGSAAEAAARVRELASAGAEVIKVCAGGGVIPSELDRDACECDEDVLASIVQAAHERGLRVAAHAQGPTAIARAAAAGVDSIEHGGQIDARLAADLAARRIVLVPTLARLDVLIENADRSGAPVDSRGRLRRARELVYASAKEAVAAGVRIALGTDATVLPHGENAREFRALAEVGLSPLEALRSATIHAAELIGWEDRVGALEPGLFADAIAVRGDPLQDVAVFEHVQFVMKGGAVVRSPVP
jgi:imidazolonepropionase-like amidohydrolase